MITYFFKYIFIVIEHFCTGLRSESFLECNNLALTFKSENNYNNITNLFEGCRTNFHHL